MMAKLPRKHVHIGAAVIFAIGFFTGAMTMMGGSFVDRSYGRQYAVAGLQDWLIDLFGRLGAGVSFMALGALGALAVFLVGRRFCE